jgi:hypothetical protein
MPEFSAEIMAALLSYPITSWFDMANEATVKPT